MDVDTWAAALKAVDARESELLRQVREHRPADPVLAALLESLDLPEAEPEVKRRFRTHPVGVVANLSRVLERVEVRAFRPRERRSPWNHERVVVVVRTEYATT